MAKKTSRRGRGRGRTQRRGRGRTQRRGRGMSGGALLFPRWRNGAT